MLLSKHLVQNVGILWLFLRLILTVNVESLKGWCKAGKSGGGGGGGGGGAKYPGPGVLRGARKSRYNVCILFIIGNFHRDRGPCSQIVILSWGPWLALTGLGVGHFTISNRPCWGGRACRSPDFQTNTVII
jgi:hypothetical protein